MENETKEGRKANSQAEASRDPKGPGPIRKVIDEIREFLEDLVEPPRPLVPVPVRRPRPIRRRR